MTELTSSRRWLVWALRIGVLVLVGLGVSGTARNAWDQLAQHEWHVRPPWLLASGALYAAGLVPMAWFWQRSLAALGQVVPWRVTLRGYFYGHLGKYVPGKALAVILRVAVVSKWVASIRIAFVTAMLETLMMMAAGAFLAAALALMVLRLEPALAVLAAAMAVAVGLPTLPPIARWLARLGSTRLKARDKAENASSIPNVDVDWSGLNLRLWASGWLAACVCWTLLGLSLWATLRAIGVPHLDPLGDLPLMVAAAAFAVVAGFASMLPGGLVVRDALLMQLLAPTCGAANALVAAVLVRLVWLVSELAMCVILYVAAKGGERGTRSRESTSQN